MRPWSHSRISCVEECLHRYYLTHVEQVEPVAVPDYMTEGAKLHKIFQGALENEHNNIPTEAGDIGSAWERVVPLVRGFFAEVKLAVDADGNPTGFDSPDAFLRGIVDATNQTTNVYDYKFGKSLMYDKNQADIYAYLIYAISLTKWPIRVSFLFPLENSLVTKTFDYDSRTLAQDVFIPLRHRLLEIEAGLADLDESNPDEWEPNTQSCNFCLVWHKCKHFNRGISWTA